MTRKQKYRQFLIRLIWIMIIFTCLFSYYYIRHMIPGKIRVVVGEEGTFQFSLPWGSTLETENEEVLLGSISNIPEGAVRINTDRAFTVEGTSLGSYDMDIKLFGWLPLRNIQVDVVESRSVIPGGESIGLYLEMDGVMVVGTSELTDKEGNIVEPAYGIVKSGDYILEANGQPVTDKEALIAAISSNGEAPCVFKIRRDGEIMEAKVDTVLTSDGSCKAGIWVRDDAQGIGTLTYVDENGYFGALGHAMSDTDTGQQLEASGGDLQKAQIQDVIKGQSGTPGSLLGTIVYSDSHWGDVFGNTAAGVFGHTELANWDMKAADAIPVGFKQDVKLGPASIRCSADGEVKEYDIEIIKADITTDSNKGMVVQVTDPELLELTGGIVQGMSGSPIIQDGKVVGAVTHVFVQDSTKGYGIFLETMLEKQEETVKK
ncbi:SpoIVB peptidase [Qiania dongpingensis]|uniref:SpoIVB peptidase n=1 Tax=Qiania dongpingensis TaxID=2763669 RepID=A0A7G9G570_9FIRM|nr:SpoIVB peptidase [Qiania dongpingensis]QNM05952.1 SpoIVB peptidase [Qiania dongpingensis]